MDAEALNTYFPDLSAEQKDQFKAIGPLYSEWNEKINVISRKDIDELYTRHILHSLAIVKFLQFVPSSRILDLGTGGGFPGIPLAIYFPACHFHLVDSIGKKISVVKEVAKALDLTNVTAEHARVERVGGQYDFIVSRAVARSRQLFQWTHQKISRKNQNTLENGWILLKGGDLTEEMQELKRPYQEVAIPTYFTEDFFDTKKIIYIPK